MTDLLDANTVTKATEISKKIVTSQSTLTRLFKNSFHIKKI